MDRYWGHYALNDLLKERGRFFGPNGTHNASSYACGNRSFAGFWPDSLYCEYKRAFPQKETYKQAQAHLFPIVQRRIGNKTKNQGVMVHIRMGDVIDNATYSVVELLTDQTFYWPEYPDGAWNRYVMPLKHYDAVAVKLTPGQPVTLIGSPHQPDYATWTQPFKRSCVYTYAVAAHMQEMGHPVQVRVGQAAPDDDLVIMANSETFVPSGGGYSKLVQEMVHKNGGNVLNTATVIMMEKFLRWSQLRRGDGDPS